MIVFSFENVPNSHSSSVPYNRRHKTGDSIAVAPVHNSDLRGTEDCTSFWKTFGSYAVPHPSTQPRNLGHKVGTLSPAECNYKRIRNVS